MTHFNGLTPAEQERLSLLVEECGEVLHVIGKIQRHGYESRHPDGDVTNRGLLERELGDLKAAIRLMIWENDLNEILVVEAETKKLFSVRQWLHHHPHLKESP